MNIQKISVGPYQVNCVVVWGEAKQALIIDPGYDATDIEAALQENGLEVAAYLLTHGHVDHISALAELHAAHPAPVYMHAADEQWAFEPANQLAPYYPIPTKPGTLFMNPTDTLPCDDIQCIETPGHTLGGVCYWFVKEGVCFTGDTLFKGSCGRTDLPGGDARTLTASLGKLAKTLPPDTRIIAGHGDDSTMSHELATNFFLQRFQS